MRGLKISVVVFMVMFTIWAIAAHSVTQTSREGLPGGRVPTGSRVRYVGR